MCESLLYAVPQWTNTNIDNTSISADDSPLRCILEIDIGYPGELHDVHIYLFGGTYASFKFKIP